MSSNDGNDSENDEIMETDDNPLPPYEEKEDSNDSSEDDDEESLLIKKYIEILGKIEEHKYKYDDYVALVDTAHSLSDLDKIRQSCELFSVVYPLSPEIWLKWLRIEVATSTSDEELENANKLFKRALSDYFSIDVAIEYTNLAVKSINGPEIWEEILSTYSLHCTKGRSLFEAWRAHFIKKAETPEQIKKVVEIFEKELSLPLTGMEDSYIEFKLFCEKHKELVEVDWKKFEVNYNKAKNQLKTMIPFEKEIKDLDPKFHQNRASLYKDYIYDCSKFLDNENIQVLYERMITDCCLNASVWLEYIKYVQNRKSIKVQKSWVFEQSDLDIVNRALKNCTWSVELYIEKIRIVERKELPKQEVQAILEFALTAGFQTPEPIVTIWLEYLAYLRRNTDYENEKDVELLRANFNLCWTSLGKQWDALADCNCEILQFWGRLEYGPLFDAVKGRELWTTVMESSDNSTKSGLWIEFIQLELKKGVEAARRIYKKAIQSTNLDCPEIISSAWLRFERCNGTLDSLIACQTLCNSILTEYNQLQQANRFASYKNRPQTNNKERSAPRRKEEEFRKPAALKERSERSERSEKSEIPKGKKRPHPENEKEENFKRSRPEEDNKPTEEERDESKDHITVFISNLDYNVTEDEITANFPELKIINLNLIKNVNGKSRGFGYAQLETEFDVKKALSFDRRPINGRPTFISTISREKSKRDKFKYAETLEPTKLFVKGLCYDSTKEDLEKVFKEFGPLKDVRIATHKNGKSKGIAYIEFVEESAAKKAVFKMDQHVLQGFTISVSLSAPPPRMNSRDDNPTSSLGGGKRVISRGEVKPRMSFIPQSVLKKAAPTDNKIKADQNGGASSSKSNEDFRKLLMK